MNKTLSGFKIINMEFRLDEVMVIPEDQTARTWIVEQCKGQYHIDSEDGTVFMHQSHALRMLETWFREHVEDQLTPEQKEEAKKPFIT